jgi:probable rRNA maturation factor
MSIEINNESGAEVDEGALQRLATFALDHLHVHADADLAILMVDEAAMEQLHVQWMDEPGPTDVLSFPMDELRPGDDGDVDEEGILGDMLLCPQYAAAQAPSFSRTPDDEMRLLTIHGILHLLGYDHAEPDEEREMFSLQARLLAEWQGVRSGEAVE